MSSVVVLSTGGTIASRRGHGDGAVAVDGVSDLMDQVDLPGGVRVEGRDVLRSNSFSLTPDDMVVVLRAVVQALSDPGVGGVVVTHGTDTMEETALLVDLFVDDHRPVVFTGAQRAADHLDSDGPTNLRDAVLVCADPSARDLGVVILFDGMLNAARGATKAHTVAPTAFTNSRSGAVGRIRDGELVVFSRPRRFPIGQVEALSDQTLPRVDVVCVYAGADAAALDAVIAAGARGVVLACLGAGNVTPALADAVSDYLRSGGVVVLSTRVPAGPVVALYAGSGGGVDLVADGALLAGSYRPWQSRIMLSALLAIDADTDHIRQAFNS